MNHLTLVILSLSIIMFSCNKENELPQKINYVDTDYYPGSNEKVKEEILEFLALTKTYNNAIAKTNLLGLNKTPSEGKWLMEGASNYLSNVNLDLVTDTVIEFEIEIDNLLSNDGSILMDGADMVTEFDNLHLDINSVGNSIDKTAKIVDYEITEVTTNSTTIGIKTVYGKVGPIFNWGNFTNDVSPQDVFDSYETKLLIELSNVNADFYTNITYGGLTPYVHISDVTDPNYYPQQDPSSPLFNPNLQKCGRNHLGQTDCRICYDCLWNEEETTFLPYNNITRTWTAEQATYYYNGTKTVIQNFINNTNYTSGLVDVEIEHNSMICPCQTPSDWQQLTFILGKGSNY